jgi:hypothetical protein
MLDYEEALDDRTRPRMKSKPVIEGSGPMCYASTGVDDSRGMLQR